MTDVDISCLCGKVRALVSLVDSVPVKSVICHRSQCRYNLGALCHSTLPVKARPERIDLLQTYTATEGISRYFCGTCGSHVYEYSNGWKVQSGAVDRIHSEQVSDTLERIVGHRYVQETQDGGLSRCLTGPAGMVSEEHMQAIELSSMVDEQGGAPGAISTLNEDDRARLWASCLCGGSQFFLTRPTKASSQYFSPWPDLIVPYHAQSSDNPHDYKWWIRDGGKWLAGTCACRSCRLSLGSPIQAWAFVSRSDIFQPNGNPLSYTMGTLRSFESSPGATREFCSRCGATVFWHNSHRPGVVDVSVGLLRAPEGALARNWLEWWLSRVSFAEEALDKNLVACLGTGLGSLAT